MFKLTDEQRQEILSVLNEMLANTEKGKERLSKLTDWWNEDFNKLFTETINDIKNLIKKIETDKDFELSKDILHTALIFEIAQTKDKSTLCKLNMGFSSK